MARLPQGEREERSHNILRLLQRHRWGLREGEIAEETDLDRRTINNYLRELAQANKVDKEGRLWFFKK